MPRSVLLPFLPKSINWGHHLNQGRVCWLISPNGEASFIPDIVGNSQIRFAAASGNDWKIGGPQHPGQIGPAWRPSVTAMLQNNSKSNALANLRSNINGFTVGFWIWPDSVAAQWCVGMGSVDVSSVGSGWNCHLSSSGQRPSFYSGRASSFDGYRTDNGSPVPLRAWSRVLFSWRTFGADANSVRVYVNGVEYSMSRNVPGNGLFVNEGLAQLNLLSLSTGGSPTPAWITDVGIWIRRFSAQEAWADYRESIAGYPGAFSSIEMLAMPAARAPIIRSITSTLNLTQTQVGNRIVTESVTSTLVPTQTQVANLVTSNNATSTLTFTQTVEVLIVSNQFVISTLVPTQSISNNFDDVESLPSTLNLTQDIFVNIVSNQEVTSTLTLTQVIAPTFTQSIQSNLTLTQTIVEQIFKFASNTSTLALTQTIGLVKITNKNLNSNLNLHHILTLTKITNLALSQGIIFTETTTGNASRSVSNTLTFTQTIDVVYIKRVSSFLEFTAIASLNTVLRRTIISLFNPHQTISRNVVYNRTVTSNFTPTQIIVGHRVIPLTQNLIFTQIFDVTNAKPVLNNLIFTQDITYNQIRNLEVSNILILDQEIDADKVLLRSVVPSVLAFDQFISVHKVYFESVTSSLNFTQEIIHSRFLEDITSTLNLVQTIQKTKIINLSLSQSLALTQSVSLATVIRRSVTSNLIFLPYYIKPLAGVDVLFPTLIVGKTERFTILQARGRIITLPNPIFGDAEANTGIFTLRCGLRGKTYTYVKTTDFRKLAYTFQVPRIKAYELIDFVQSNNSELIQIKNWKGEIWYVFITNNPTDFTSTDRYANDLASDTQREKVEVHMEFEGYRLV